MTGYIYLIRNTVNGKGYRAKLSAAKLGRAPWNKGKRGVS